MIYLKSVEKATLFPVVEMATVSYSQTSDLTHSTDISLVKFSDKD